MFCPYRQAGGTFAVKSLCGFDVTKLAKANE
ncbi:hypothetical protein EPYR_01878 [Erwinia pyrifoliae DSM 12163]|nr:hypothetical protein EPYR_01878 [Erwinia pyrifoliae DSM 12163]